MWWLIVGAISLPIIAWMIYCLFRVVQVVRISAGDEDEDEPKNPN